jgi:carbonic anhydrase/acetyltransferase-like protein (isoleucine patch superfamily)
MRKVIIRKKEQVAPFNEVAYDLRIINKTLEQHQAEALEGIADEESVVETFDTIPPDTVETLVYADNIYFDREFIEVFLAEARQRGRACQAAFRSTDPAFLQQGLRALTRSLTTRGDLFMLDLWYFPNGLTRAPAKSQTEPVIIESASQEFTYYRTPSYATSGPSNLVWHIPKRVALPIDSWLHVFFCSIVFGLGKRAVHQRVTPDAASRLRSLIERPFRPTDATVVMGEGCHIDPSVTFSGHVTIGDNVTIGPGCVLSECVIGDNVTLAHGNHFYMCVIGDNCFLPGAANATFTTLMENVSVGQSASLEMSVVGRNSYVGAGTIFSTYPLVPGPIEVRVDYEPIELDMPVLGGCVGHNCRIGSGLVVYPGCAIESDVVLFPSPTRRVIMNDITYEESDHHASPTAGTHPRQYPRGTA